MTTFSSTSKVVGDFPCLASCETSNLLDYHAALKRIQRRAQGQINQSGSAGPYKWASFTVSPHSWRDGDQHINRKLKLACQTWVCWERLTHLVIFFLQDKDYISRLHAGRLVSFATEGYFLAVLHAFVHVHFQNLHLLHNFLALTFFAAVFLTNNLTWSGLNETKRVKRGLPSNISQGSFTFHITATYLLRYNRYTQTASAGPFQAPAVWSWRACHGPDTLRTSARPPSSPPVCRRTQRNESQQQTVHTINVMLKGKRSLQAYPLQVLQSTFLLSWSLVVFPL